MAAQLPPPEDSIDAIPDVTPRQSLLPGNKRDIATDAINTARRASGTLPMRFDAYARETPVAEVMTPKEAEDVPPTGGVLVYRSAPFIKQAAEGAKKFAAQWRGTTPPGDEGRLKSFIDSSKFAQAGSHASNEARAAMKEAGPPDRFDLNQVRINVSRDKPHTTRHREQGVRDYKGTVENFPVSITVPGKKEPIVLGTFERSGDAPGSTVRGMGTRWYFDTNENVMLHLKEDRLPLLNALKNYLSTNNMGHYVNEVKKGVGTRGAGSGVPGVDWFDPN